MNIKKNQQIKPIGYLGKIANIRHRNLIYKSNYSSNYP